MYTELVEKIEQMMPILNEKQLRRYLGSEAEALGRGGIAIVSKISGKSRNTIVAGIKENDMPENDMERIRKSGGGRNSIKEKHPEIAAEIESIVKNSTFGNPENQLAYTTKSTRKIKHILNGRRNRLFKVKLQQFADQSCIDVHIPHFPPGTSKWNKVEHMLFYYISSNWRGQPLVSIETIINLIGNTTTTSGLKVICVKDENK